MAGYRTLRLATILATLALGGLGATALADTPDHGWNAHRGETRARDRGQWRSDDGRRYGNRGNPSYGSYGYRYRSYGYGSYGPVYRYEPRGYDYGYRHYRRSDGHDDDAALTIAGGVIGGLIGNRAASPENRAAGTVFGAVIGGVIGHAIGQSNNDDRRRYDRYRYRYDD